MKKFKSLLTALSFLSLTIFIACGGGNGGDDDVTPSAGEIQAGLLSATWTADFNSNPNAVTFDGQARGDDWGSFSLTISNVAEGADGIWGGNYSASGQPAGDGQVVWPASGTWSFPSTTDVQSIIRNDGVEVTISSVTETTLTLVFTVPEPTSRTDGFFDLPFTFNLTR